MSNKMYKICIYTPCGVNEDRFTEFIYRRLSIESEDDEFQLYKISRDDPNVSEHEEILKDMDLVILGRYSSTNERELLPLLDVVNEVSPDVTVLLAVLSTEGEDSYVFNDTDEEVSELINDINDMYKPVDTSIHTSLLPYVQGWIIAFILLCIGRFSM